MIISQPALAKAASTCAKIAAGSEYALQLEGDDGVRLKVANGQHWLTLEIDGEGDPFGVIHLDAATFAGVIANLSSASAELKFAAGKLAVTSGTGKRTLALRQDKLPDRPFEPETSINLDANALRSAIDFTLPHAAPPGDVVKWFAAGVHLHGDGQEIRAYGADGKTLAIADIGPSSERFGVTIDHKAAEMVSQAPDGTITLDIGAKAVRLRWPGLELIASIIDGAYPLAIIAKALEFDWTGAASFEALSFLSSVRRVRLLGEQDRSARSERLALTLNGKATLTGRSASGEATEEFPADYEGDEFTIGIIASQTERTLKGFGDAVLNASFSTDVDPIRLVPAGRNDRLVLLYPVKL